MYKYRKGKIESLSGIALLGLGLAYGSSVHAICQDNSVPAVKKPEPVELVNAYKVPKQKIFYHRTPNFWKPKCPEINVDIKNNVGGLKRQYGGYEFKKSLLMGSISVSQYLNDVFGLEFGYEASQPLNKDVVTNDGSIVFGAVQNIFDMENDEDAVGPVSFGNGTLGRFLYSRNKYSEHGPFLLAKTKYQICMPNENYVALEFFAGLSWTKFTMLHAPYAHRASDNSYLAFNQAQRDIFRIYLQGHKLIPIVGVNVETALSRRAKLTAGVAFRGTSRIKAQDYYPVDGYDGRVKVLRKFKMNNQFTYKIGFSFAI